MAGRIDCGAAATLPDAPREQIEADLEALATSSRVWSTLDLGQRARLLGRLRDTVGAATEK